uniref:Doublecortin domain containing 2B n=1 Tax=Echeneis naucrates TaxID=173247 RepID=A0A665V017_ECHNA
FMGGSSALTNVMVYRNGDPFYSGRRFVVNQRQVATMEAFLNEVTRNIGAPLAVRTLYTPRQGTRISDLQDLQAGAQYVAAGGMRCQPALLLKQVDLFEPFVFRNGDLLCPPFRFIIPRTMQQDLEQILSLVTEKVSLRTGAVRRLCSLEGATVSSAGQLETGHCYVAVGTERFKKLPYVELLVSKATERYCYARSSVSVHACTKDFRSQEVIQPGNEIKITGLTHWSKDNSGTLET